MSCVKIQHLFNVVDNFMSTYIAVVYFAFCKTLFEKFLSVISGINCDTLLLFLNEEMCSRCLQMLGNEYLFHNIDYLCSLPECASCEICHNILLCQHSLQMFYNANLYKDFDKYLCCAQNHKDVQLWQAVYRVAKCPVLSWTVWYLGRKHERIPDKEVQVMKKLQICMPQAAGVQFLWRIFGNHSCINSSAINVNTSSCIKLHMGMGESMGRYVIVLLK